MPNQPLNEPATEAEIKLRPVNFSGFLCFSLEMNFRPDKTGKLLPD